MNSGKEVRMKVFRAMAFMMIGGISGVVFGPVIRAYVYPPAVHAQDQFTTFAGCISVVPRAWGNFVGASPYGLTFQDEAGTLRFLAHPVCGTVSSALSLPTATIDLQIQRR